MIRNLHALSFALVTLLAAGSAMADKPPAREKSQGPVNADPNAGGFSQPNSVLYQNVSNVPEPETLALAAAGVAVLVWARRRRNK